MEGFTDEKFETSQTEAAFQAPKQTMVIMVVTWMFAERMDRMKVRLDVCNRLRDRGGGDQGFSYTHPCADDKMLIPEQREEH